MTERGLNDPGGQYLCRHVEKFSRALGKGIISPDEFCQHILLKLAAEGSAAWAGVLGAFDCESLRLLVHYCNAHVDEHFSAPAELFFPSMPSQLELEAKREELTRSYLSLANALIFECKRRCSEGG
jgi:hypothetical protein